MLTHLPLSPLPLSWKKIVSFGSHSSRHCDFGFGSKFSLECH